MVCRWWSAAALAALVCAIAGSRVVAGPAAEDGPASGGAEVELADSVKTLLAAPYLTEEERRAARVFHGVWEPGDLSTPALRARAALLSGVWDDPSLESPEAAVEDRAEAMVERGELERAIAALEGAAGARAARLRAEAYEGLGRFKDADEAAGPAAALLGEKDASASDLTEGVRALNLRARLRGQPAQEYRRMIGLLSRAHDEVDRLHHPSVVMEAALLLEKDNRPESAQAALRAVSLNPRLGSAWAHLGRMAVDAFEFAGARDAARQLDKAARLLRAEGSASALAAEVRALVWLRQKEPDLADEELAPALARYPKRRELLALSAASAALRFDPAERDRRFAAFDALSPGSPAALFQAGKAVAEARQYAEAARLLRLASERQPKWPAPLIELGLLELQSGRDAEATEALRAASALDPFNIRANNSLRLIEELAKYQRVESEHFIVRFSEPDRVLAEEMPAVLEEIHRVVAGALKHTPERKTVLELLPDHEWFAVRITGMPDIHTIAASTGPVIAMESPRVGPRHTGEYDWERVVRHEYVHTVGLSRTKNRIPHWFTEAMAVRYELAPRDQSDCELLAEALLSGGLFDMRKINIAFVRPEKPTDRQQAYAQGAWMYEFIVERWGEDAPLRMMDLYAEGAREDQAMRGVLGVSQEEFFAGFVAWARAQAASWGLTPEPSLEAIVLEATLAGGEGRAAALGAVRAMGWRLAAKSAGLAGPGAPRAIAKIRPTPERVDEWLAKRPDHPDLLRLKVAAEQARAGGEATAEMIPLLERYAAARPVDMAPRKMLARLHLASADQQRAVAHLEALDAREQKTAAYAVELARLHAEARRLDDAARKAERAVRIAPFNGQHRELAARIALLRQDYGTAERHIVALTRLEPDQPLHYQRLQRVRERRAATQ